MPKIKNPNYEDARKKMAKKNEAIAQKVFMAIEGNKGRSIDFADLRKALKISENAKLNDADLQSILEDAGYEMDVA